MGDMLILVSVMWRVAARLLRYLGRGVLLVPVAAMGMALFGLRPWTVATVALALVVAVWRPVVAAALLPVTMVAAGISGLVAAATTPAPSWWAVSALVAIKQRLVSARAGVKAAQIKMSRAGVVTGRRSVVAPLAPGSGSRAAVNAPVAGSRATVNALVPGLRGPVKMPAGAHFYGHAPKIAVQAMAGRGWLWTVKGGGPPVQFHRAGGGFWPGYLVPLALLLLTLGLWLLPRTVAALRAHTAGLLSHLRRQMLENRWGILLIPVALLGLTVFGVHLWTVALVLVCAVTAARWPVIAADLVPVLLTAFAVRGFMIAASWQSLPPGPIRGALSYGGILVRGPQSAMLAGAEASAFLVVAAWLVPRTIGAHARATLIPGRDLELEGRVQQLTETRNLAVDHAATELRRIERDLHDGAQARLIALGMNLRAVERMLPARPEAALALVAEARETSLRALSDLRDLVRGICPPVLADRGLDHAVRALALDTPFPVDLDIDLPGRLATPVESACYFAVAEALANAVRHSGARRVHIRMQHKAGLLRVEIADDGAGGADPARGTGLRGVEQRLAAFDGILAVSSPPGGPTMIVMEVPCALSSPKTCSC
jgi:signal transduction histidine kinase